MAWMTYHFAFSPIDTESRQLHLRKENPLQKKIHTKSSSKYLSPKSTHDVTSIIETRSSVRRPKWSLSGGLNVSSSTSVNEDTVQERPKTPKEIYESAVTRMKGLHKSAVAIKKSSLSLQSRPKQPIRSKGHDSEATNMGFQTSSITEPERLEFSPIPENLSSDEQLFSEECEVNILGVVKSNTPSAASQKSRRSFEPQVSEAARKSHEISNVEEANGVAKIRRMGSKICALVTPVVAPEKLPPGISPVVINKQISSKRSESLEFRPQPRRRRKLSSYRHGSVHYILAPIQIKKEDSIPRHNCDESAPIWEEPMKVTAMVNLARTERREDDFRIYLPDENDWCHLRPHQIRDLLGKQKAFRITGPLQRWSYIGDGSLNFRVGVLNAFANCQPLNNDRIFCIKEIFTTEQTYLGSLLSILENYKKPLESMAKGSSRIASAKDVQKMFSYRNFCQVSNLVTVHTLLIEELSREVGGKGRRGLVGEVFQRSAHSLLLGYRPFAKQFARANKVMMKLEKNKRFLEFQKTQQDRTGCKELMALLMQPVQRVMRYGMLLKALDDNTPDDHEDKGNLAEAMDKIHEVVMQLDVLWHQSDFQAYR